MPTHCSDVPLIFEPFAGHKVVADFAGGAVTSHAGGLLLRETDRVIGLSQKVTRCFHDGRDPERTVHSLNTLIAQRIHGLALGYEDLNDHDELRHDPVLRLLADRLEGKRAGVAALAGKLVPVKTGIDAQPAGDGAGARRSALSQGQRRCASHGGGIPRRLSRRPQDAA